MQEKFLFFHNAVYSPVLKKQKPIVQNAMDFIQDNLCEDLSLETVAENVGVSSYYLSRIFKNEIGETFINYITALRIDKAKQLFRKYNYSVRIVCQKIGYQNPTYFCKVFKKITGQTVNEFKQTHS
jgi:two-component system response regulator YesN